MSRIWTPEVFVADDGTVPFRDFVEDLSGYDKAAHPKAKRQERELARARKLLAQFKDRQQRQR